MGQGGKRFELSVNASPEGHTSGPVKTALRPIEAAGRDSTAQLNSIPPDCTEEAGDVSKQLSSDCALLVDTARSLFDHITYPRYIVMSLSSAAEARGAFSLPGPLQREKFAQTDPRMGGGRSTFVARTRRSDRKP